MSFWSKFAKIGLAAAPFALAPFTGGTSLLGAGATGMGSKLLSGLGAAGNVLGAAGPVLGGLAQGRAQGGQAEDQARMKLFELLSSQAMNQGKLNADRAQYERDSPSVRAKQAAFGNYMQRVQPVSVSGVPSGITPIQFSGGMTPAALGSSTRRAGENLANLGASRLGHDTFEIPQMPNAPDVAKSDWIDKFLGVAAPTASILGALPKFGKRQGAAIAPPTAIPPDLESFINPNYMFRGQ